MYFGARCNFLSYRLKYFFLHTLKKFSSYATARLDRHHRRTASLTLRHLRALVQHQVMHHADPRGWRLLCYLMRCLCHYKPRGLANGSATSGWLLALPTAAHIPTGHSNHPWRATHATHLHWPRHGTVLLLYELMDSSCHHHSKATLMRLRGIHCSQWTRRSNTAGASPRCVNCNS